MLKKILLPALAAIMFFSSCKKETEEYKSASLDEYVPLQVGKYITYQLDSFRYLPFSTQGITSRYEVKFLVDAAITDNLGRPSFRIIRYIRSNPADAWVPDNTFMSTNAGDKYEFVDNNLRFVKLKLPITAGYSWRGNSYIDIYSSDPNGPDLRYLEGWEYTYDSLNAPLTLGSITLDNTIKVAQVDEVNGFPEDPSVYSDKNYSVEYYAKGIGLVYKNFLHIEYQPPGSSGGVGYYTSESKGYTLTMIDHN